MQKIEAVEIARALMTEGQKWGVWRWLLDKRKVREAADRATAALADANEAVKRTWSDELQKAYGELAADPKSRRKYEKAKEEAADVDPKIKAAAARVKAADDEAYQATMDAEDLFAEAERRMSSSMACDAARKALESY